MIRAPKMTQFIQEICDKHDVVISQPNAALHLELNDDRLILKHIGVRQMTIGHYLLLFDEWTPDPEITLWIDVEPDSVAGPLRP